MTLRPALAANDACRWATRFLNRGTFTVASDLVVPITGVSQFANSGTLTINGDVVMDASAGGTPSIHMDIDGKAAGQFDRMVGVGNMTLDGTVTVAFASGYTGSNLAVGNSFDLFDWNTVNATGFNLSSDLVLPDISTFGLGWDTSHFLDAGSAGGVISVVSTVPEPSRVVLMALALGVALLARKVPWLMRVPPL